MACVDFNNPDGLIWDKSILPIYTVKKDRYGGCYSRGEWLAFPTVYDETPDEIGSDNADELNFWDDPENAEKHKLIGRGATPPAALANLLEKLEAYHKEKTEPLVEKSHND